jgi:hypothetical protein
MWTGILWDKGVVKKVKCWRHLTTRVSTPWGLSTGAQPPLETHTHWLAKPTELGQTPVHTCNLTHTPHSSSTPAPSPPSLSLEAVFGQ